MNSCGSSVSSSKVASRPSQKCLTASVPRAESALWRSGSTHSIAGSNDSSAASKSRRLYASMNARTVSTLSSDTVVHFVRIASKTVEMANARASEVVQRHFESFADGGLEEAAKLWHPEIE